MSGVPSAGLLELLRKRNEPTGEAVPLPGASPISNAASRFEARSSAVHALEHAVAAGTLAEAARPAAQGRRIPSGPSYTYGVDVHAPHEAQPQLPVTPVTLINTDYALKHHRQIAACPAYIAYGLKQGHIRVLSRSSALRALLKGHTKPLTDLAFAPAGAGGSNGGSTLLASGAADGQLYVWQLRVDQDEGIIRDTQKLHASFVAGGASGGDVFLSWHSPGTLAAGVGGHVLLVSVPAEGMEQLEFDLSEESTPDATVLPDWSGEQVSCLSFSPDGALLAAGGGDGGVGVWHLRGTAGRPALEVASSASLPPPPGGGPIGAVRWLAASEASGYVLLVGNKNNTALQLWHTPAADNPWTLLQTLIIQGKDGPLEFFIHAEVVPGQQLVVLADTARKAIHTLHFSGEGASLRFDYITRFGVTVPILSFTAGYNPAGGGEHDAAVVELLCVQTTAIQQYSLDPLLCHDGAAPEGDDSGEGEGPSDGVVRRSSLLERDGRHLGIQPQPSEAVPMPSPELASGTPTPRSASVSPTKLDGAQPEAAAVAAEPSIEGTVSLAGIPPPPAPQEAESEEADGVEEGELEPKGASGEITPEECPSPPPTPTEERRLHEQAEAAAEVAEAAPAPVAPTQPPRLLTPSDLLQSASTSSATTGRRSPAGAAGGAAAAPLAAAAEPAAAQEQEEPLASPPAVPAAAPAAAASQLDEAAVAAAVAEAMGGVHKKFVGHVSLMYRELLKAMKAEMSAQAAAQQAALAQLLAATAEAQKQQIEAERAAVLAEERASIERLLTAISATLNRDLPTKLAEAVRGELAGLADGVAAAVAPSVQASLAGTLQKELGGAVKAGLDKQLSGAVAAGVAKPLQDAVRAAFTKQVVPALEGATQAAFKQVDAALAAGLEEHLQASRAALSEPGQLAAQLAASLSSAQSLAASLSQGQQQLLRAQSIGGTGGTHSPAAPADVRGELSALLRSGSYEAAFSKALGLQDVATLGWLAAQADAGTVLSREPCPLSQMVLLSLVQQLSADLTTELSAKLAWIREAAMLINPRDPLLARHVRPVLDGVHSALHAAAARVTGGEASSCRLAMHVVHSQLTS